jgi:hypothetical protein
MLWESPDRFFPSPYADGEALGTGFQTFLRNISENFGSFPEDSSTLIIVTVFLSVHVQQLENHQTDFSDTYIEYY